MWRYLRALGYLITGRFSEALKTLQENKHVMAATYDKAIEKSADRFTTVRNAVAELVTIEQNHISRIKETGAKIERLERIKHGAQQKMQDYINVLKAKGVSKEDILKDAEFIKDKGVFDETSATLQETKKTFDGLESDLTERQKQIAVFKLELQTMQRAGDTLRQEKQEALADVAIAQQSEAISNTLAGLSNDSYDKDLAQAREARQRAKSRANVTSQLAGNDAKLADEEYIKYGQEKMSNSELDKLLDWGEDSAETMAPAKLPDPA